MAEQNAPETTQANATEVVEGEAQEATNEADVQATVDDSLVEDPTREPDVDESASELERERAARKKANREAKNLRERLKKYDEAEEQRKQEAMSELEKAQAQRQKLEAERDEAAKDAQSAREELKSLRVRQEATSKALTSGAKQERLEAILRLTDLGAASLTDEEGNPDSKAIETAIKATLKEYPEFKVGSKDIGGPTNPGTDAPNGSKSVANMTDEELAQLSQRVQWGERVTFP